MALTKKQKNVVYTLWACLLLAFFVGMGMKFRQLIHNICMADFDVEETYFYLPALKQNIINPIEFNELLSCGEVFLLSIGSGDCSVCDLLLLSKEYHHLPLKTYFIDRDKHPYNQLVSQALESYQSPDHFLISAEMEIIEQVPNAMSALYAQIETALRNNQSAEKDSMEEEKKKRLSSSLKTAIYFISRDFGSFEEQLSDLRTRRSDCFADYLMYRYYQTEVINPDSMNHYGKLALEAINTPQGEYLFENVIHEIRPD